MGVQSVIWNGKWRNNKSDKAADQLLPRISFSESGIKEIQLWWWWGFWEVEEGDWSKPGQCLKPLHWEGFTCSTSPRYCKLLIVFGFSLMCCIPQSFLVPVLWNLTFCCTRDSCNYCILSFCFLWLIFLPARIIECFSLFVLHSG